MSDIDHAQIKLHDKWKKSPETYVKPPGNPIAERKANLIHGTTIKDDMSYLLFVDGKLVRQVGSAGFEFLQMDPEPMRAATIAMKTKPGFHVYYKQGNFWYGIPQHFNGLADAIPYCFTGLRVLIEYRFTVQTVKYFVMHGFEYGGHHTVGEVPLHQGKWRRPLELCELYGVDPADCLFEEYPGYLPPTGGCIVLRPLYHPDWQTLDDKARPDYDLQRRSLKHFGKLAPTK
jgi:hypothetical protein